MLQIPKQYKSLLIKTLSVFVAVMLVLSLAPLLDISDLLLNASAAEMPEYNPNYGSYTASTVNGNTVLTATANEGCGFRGWYYKDGTEVAYTSEYTVPSGESAEDYIPVFYSYNLATNGDFEAHEVGTNLKTNASAEEAWDGICDSELAGNDDWTSMKVSEDRAKSGSKSLSIYAPSNTAYHTFNGLDKNTQYTVSFWYNIDPSEGTTAAGVAFQHYLTHVSVVAGDAEITARANRDGSYLAKQSYNSTSGATAAGEWKQASVTFYTNENTSVNLCLLYNSTDDKENNIASKPLYIDDLTLVKDVFAAPTYVNENFANSASYNWSAYNSKYVTLTTDNQRLHISSAWTFQCVHGAPMFLKAGAEYTLSFKLDMSEVTHPKVPLKDGSEYIKDADGNIQYTSQTNWINFNISNTERLWGQSQYYENEDKEWVSRLDEPNLVTDHSAKGPYGNDVKITVTDTSSTATIDKSSYWAAFGFHKDTVVEKGLDPANLVITMTFTPDKTGEYYFNTRLNADGDYYLDDFKITEAQKNVDPKEYIMDNAIESLGTAIRTEGKQGMRYKTEIDKRLLAAEMYYGVRLTEYGTVAIRSEFLGNSELVLDGQYDYNGKTYSSKKGVAYSFENNTDLVYADNAENLHFTGVLMNIGQEYWNSDYTARAYFKYVDADGNEGTLYVDPSDISIYPISKAAYSAKDADGNFTENEEVREYLYNKIISKFTDKVIKVNNSTAPVYSNFEGIRSTVYHATTFFPSSHGRTYTEEQAAIEMDRLKDTKVDNVRTRFASQWMWKEGTGWDWESDKMDAIYKWAEMLEERDISITLNAGWHLHDFIYFYDEKFNNDAHHYNSDNGHSSIREESYLHGYKDDLTEIADIYGEDEKAASIKAMGQKVGLNLTDSEYDYYSVAAARYSEWITQGLLALKAHGINNVEYVLPFTETGYVAYEDHSVSAADRVVDPTYSYDEWILMVMALQDSMKEAGIRNNYKVIGPSQSNYAYQNREVQFVEYIYEKIKGTDYEDMIDIVSMHQYTAPNTQAGYENTIYEPYASYSRASENFELYEQIRENAGVTDKEFWCDEYSAYANDSKMHEGIGMQMTQFAAGLTAGINNGVNRFSTWQMFDCLWDSTATHGSAYLPDRAEWDEFIGGVHACGTCPSLIKADGETCTIEGCACKNYTPYSSYVPRVTYYGINLIGKYMNNENASVYATEVIDDAAKDNGGVYVSAIKNDDGMDVIMVVNTMPTVSSFDLQIENDEIVSFERYTYDPEVIVPTKEAKSIESDKTITLNGETSFRDELPAGSFAIYVSTGIYRGDDVDMPIEPEE